jgi:hypothetical protein
VPEVQRKKFAAPHRRQLEGANDAEADDRARLPSPLSTDRLSRQLPVQVGVIRKRQCRDKKTAYANLNYLAIVLVRGESYWGIRRW